MNLRALSCVPVTRPRQHIVCLSDTPYYHVTARCVRRAFLCGEDPLSGNSYEHRRSWVEDRIRVLASLFAIDICAYAVMSNHYHLVVRLQHDGGENWSDEEVLSRWTALFRGPLLVQQFRAGRALSADERDTLGALASVYRTRLASLSWFMKCLNEPIARRANAEDGCRGHFWEARFHSQPLRSTNALLAAMAYVDLNPIRAGIAKTPERSNYTSIQARTAGNYCQATLSGAVKRLLASRELKHFETTVRPLLGFRPRQGSEQSVHDGPQSIPMYECDYLKLIDATARVVNGGKRGCLDPTTSPILERLGLTGNEWTKVSTMFREHCRVGDIQLKKVS